MRTITPSRGGYRKHRWPLWDPDAAEWMPLYMGEQPRTWWQAFRGAGLRGIRWLRRHRAQEALLDSYFIAMRLKDRYRADRRSETVLETEPRRTRQPIPERQKIRHRIRSRPFGSVFWSHELSDDAALAEATLIELAAEQDNGLEELAPGFWCYGIPPSKLADGSAGPMVLSPAYVGLRYAGLGAGFASMDALNRVGWTTQVTAKTRIAVMDGTPEPLSRVVAHETRDNAARRDLGWAEVTFIEALHTILMAEKDPDHIIEDMLSGSMIRRLGPTAHIRGSAVQRSFLLEQPIEPPSVPLLRDQCRQQQKEILEAMPARMSAADHAVRSAAVNYWAQL